MLTELSLACLQKSAEMYSLFIGDGNALIAEPD